MLLINAYITLTDVLRSQFVLLCADSLASSYDEYGSVNDVLVSNTTQVTGEGFC